VAAICSLVSTSLADFQQRLGDLLDGLLDARFRPSGLAPPRRCADPRARAPGPTRWGGGAVARDVVVFLATSLTSFSGRSLVRVLAARSPGDGHAIVGDRGRPLSQGRRCGPWAPASPSRVGGALRPRSSRDGPLRRTQYLGHCECFLRIGGCTSCWSGVGRDGRP